MTYLCSLGVLKPLCFIGNIAIYKAFNVKGLFLARFKDVEALSMLCLNIKLNCVFIFLDLFVQ